MKLFLNESIARKKFKDLLGNANHFLITILVGLNGIESGLISICPEELRTSWNPKDKVVSANRARIMVLEMTLVRATDALDAYITWARRTPSLIQNDAVQSRIDSAGQSVFYKFKVICDSSPPLDRKINALIEVMIAWRNRVVHSFAASEVSKESWEILEKNKDWLKDTFQGMEFSRLFSDFNKGGPPTFKETASFIRATQKFIEQLDEIYLKNLDPEVYLKSLISKNLGADKAKMLQSIWGRDEKDRLARMTGFLKNLGLSETSSYPYAAVFSDELVLKISKFTPKEMNVYLEGSGNVEV